MVYPSYITSHSLLTPSLLLHIDLGVCAGPRGGGSAGVTASSCVSQSTVDKLLKKTNLALVIGTNSWREQFVEAITVSSGTAPHTC